MFSENDRQFTSQEFEHFTQMNGINQSTPPIIYHPATNGQAENFVKTFKKCVSANLKHKIQVVLTQLSVNFGKQSTVALKNHLLKYLIKIITLEQMNMMTA